MKEEQKDEEEEQDIQMSPELVREKLPTTKLVEATPETQASLKKEPQNKVVIQMAAESDNNRSQSIKNDSQERSNEESDNSGSSLNKATVKLNLIK